MFSSKKPSTLIDVIVEGKTIKRFKAKEKRQEAVLMQQLWRKDVPAPSGEVSSPDNATSITALYTDTSLN